MGELFEKADFSASDGSIENLLNPLSGWRLPTQSEWSSILGQIRSGSIVNGSEECHYTGVYLTGVTHTNNAEAEDDPYGLLLFPDDKIITGKAFAEIDDMQETTNLTLSELNVYLGQGCVFLPASGSYTDQGDWNSGDEYGYFWSSSEDGSRAYNICFALGDLYTNFKDYKDTYIPVRLVKSTE